MTAASSMTYLPGGGVGPSSKDSSEGRVSFAFPLGISPWTVLSLAATHAHNRGLIWGIVLVVLGVLHLTFRRFYARRAKAVHDARQDTASRAGAPFYRRHGPEWYMNWEIWGGLGMIGFGILLAAIS